MTVTSKEQIIYRSYDIHKAQIFRFHISPLMKLFLLQARDELLQALPFLDELSQVEVGLENHH